MVSTTSGNVRVGGGLSTELDPEAAVLEAANEAARALGGEDANLVLAFVAHEHHDAADEIASLIAQRFPLAAVAGAVGRGVIGGARELEQGAAVSILAACLPDTNVQRFSLTFDEDEATYEGWPDLVPVDATALVVCDPFSFPVAHFLSTVNAERPGLRIVGGVASGVHGAGEARLISGERVLRDGAVGLIVSGRVRLEPLVSQGCRPIGEPATITRADRNIIFELAGERPIDRIREIWRHAAPRERALMQNGLFIGRVVDEYKTDFGRGDFLIRNVAGADPDTGFLAVQDVVNVGETVQFHVRDPDAADEDLREMVQRVEQPATGAVLFACNGRGTNMFEKPGHDASVLHEGLGYIPVTGFFANGEMGPVGGKNFWHSFTASVALLVDGAR